jgi:hypothetical protein
MERNAIFMQEDEDLLLHDITLIPKIINLISDTKCPKREYLFGIISYYTTLNFRHKRTLELDKTKEFILENKDTICADDYLTRWASYFNETYELVFQSKNITREIAEKYGWAILKGLTGYADLTPAKQIDNSTWEIVYLAPSVKPFIHIDIKTGNFEYKGYK